MHPTTHETCEVAEHPARLLACRYDRKEDSPRSGGASYTRIDERASDALSTARSRSLSTKANASKTRVRRYARTTSLIRVSTLKSKGRPVNLLHTVNKTAPRLEDATEEGNATAPPSLCRTSKTHHESAVLARSRHQRDPHRRARQGPARHARIVTARQRCAACGRPPRLSRAPRPQAATARRDTPRARHTW